MGLVKSYYWDEINADGDDEQGFDFYEAESVRLLAEAQEAAIRFAIANAHQLSIADIMKFVREELEHNR